MNKFVLFCHLVALSLFVFAWVLVDHEISRALVSLWIGLGLTFSATALKYLWSKKNPPSP